MANLEEIREITSNVIASYDGRIQAVGEIIEKSLRMLDDSRHSEQLVKNELRDTLAKVESLRKKDFDQLMAPIFTFQEQRENEIKTFLADFLNNQRELAAQLKRMVLSGILAEMGDIEKKIQQSLIEAKGCLMEFQNEQSLIGSQLLGLSQKKEKLTLGEFKKTLDVLRTQLGLHNNVETIAI